jgi:hypothetical protein
VTEEDAASVQLCTVTQYTMRDQSRKEWPRGKMQRVCTVTLVHYNQSFRDGCPGPARW